MGGGPKTYARLILWDWEVGALWARCFMKKDILDHKTESDENFVNEFHILEVTGEDST